MEWVTSLTTGALRCRLFEESRNNRYVIGDFDMPLGLRFFRDADENGNPD